ncbi:ArnT family glycosyltransferase [Candidatus Uabimicrobium amorphum]|uniref:Glycosyl transferase n=1 Tax=Uabimicrobium amorphum TaxID=2596890 RepID=A0A5S9F4H0_UABAM|nr:glycosyltransferase family 39 protein [Candidatus Uabimicrobium amorphum]BBM85538.1 glycosyl transferase [Candidatus Uabimicrobium amorphum]
MTAKQKLFSFLFVYSVLQIILRVAISDSLLPDEAEQIINAHSGFEWGYGSEPPLYTWVQLIFLYLIPHKILALSLCKHLFLITAYIFMFLAAKKVVEDDLLAIAITCSLFFMPVIVYEAQRDLSHSVLLFTISSLTLYLFLELIAHPQTKIYLFIGICVGLGFLSKYSYILFISVLIISWLYDRDFRRVFLDKRTILAILISLVIACGHIVWAYQFLGDSNFTRKIQTVKEFSFLVSFGRTIVTFLSFTAIFIAVFLLFFFKELRHSREIKWNKFLSFHLVSFAVLLLIVFVFELKKIKTRWYLPFYFCLPLYTFILIQKDLLRKKLKCYIAAAILAAISILFVFILRTAIPDITGRYRRLNLPMRNMAEFFLQKKYDNFLIIVENRSMAGTLQMYMPNSRVITPEIQWKNLPKHGGVLAIWEKDEKIDIEGFLKKLPPHISQKVNASLKTKVQQFSANYKYSEKKAHYEYSVAFLGKQKQQNEK